MTDAASAQVIASTPTCQLCCEPAEKLSQRPAFGKSGQALATALVLVAVLFGCIDLAVTEKMADDSPVIAAGAFVVGAFAVVITIFMANILRMPQGAYMCDGCRKRVD